MPNSSCRLLSNGYKFNTDQNSELYYRPCCMFPTNQPLDIPHREQISYRETLNSINALTDSRCSPCTFLDKNKLRRTWRDFSFDIVPDDAELGDPSYLELQIDRTCNGGCIICGPWYSSYWANELKQIPIKSANDPLDQILNFVDITKTRKINFLGGEPFLSDIDSRVLPLIPQPEIVDLQYTTNASIYPSNDRIEQWKTHKSVLINFSIDGIGDRFEYIRYPLKWEIANNNINRMIQEMPDNVIFKSNHTVNILNLYYYDEFDSWYKDLFATGRFLEHTFSPAVGVLQPVEIPETLLELLKNKYDNDSKVLRLASKIKNKHNNLINYLSQLDDRRNLNWRTVFPDIVNCFN